MFPINERLLTPNKYSRPQRALSAVKGIVIHWTANESNGADAEANRRYFENRKYGRTGYGSAHYFVDSTEIVRCVPENEMAYHVGAKNYKTTKFGSYPNATTIGIEMCVNADGNFKVVYQQTLELTAKLVKKYGLDPDKDVVRHFDITGKNCPAMFTSTHWGSVNNQYAVKYGLGSSADGAWKVFKDGVKQLMTPQKGKEEKAMFSDIKGHWAKDAIESIAKKGIVNGKSDGTFAPNENMTRAQMAAVINNTLQYIEKHYQKK